MVALTNLLIEGLCKKDVLSKSGKVKIIETHISYVLLTKLHAYKIKKPVNLGFVDFSTLAKRKYYCEEEVRLNRRMAAELYVGVSAISGSPDCPVVDGDGEAIEYMVKMIRFEEAAELDTVLAHSKGLVDEFQRFSLELANFHARAPVAATESRFAGPAALAERSHENFEVFANATLADDLANRIDVLANWNNKSLQRNREIFERRKRKGKIKECHGDLHLGNMALVKGVITAFDCLEFNENFRWIDVASELAFILMDLLRVGADKMANNVLNSYLEHSGDYDLLSLLNHYMVYRAMVRAKVAYIGRASGGDNDRVIQEIDIYISLAERFIADNSKPNSVIITHGLSGCGKSWLSKRLREKPKVIQIRSDLERKRLFELGNSERSNSHLGEGIYARENKSTVYGKLAEIADGVIKAGYTVIVDATFLYRKNRNMLQRVAENNRANFHILNLHAPLAVLQGRIEKREAEGKDASEANISVLHSQVSSRELLTKDELAFVCAVNTDARLDNERLEQIARHLGI